jgi:hypothetical protein
MYTINQTCWEHNGIRPLICRRIHFHKIWYSWFFRENLNFLLYQTSKIPALYADLTTRSSYVFCACQRTHSSSTHARPLKYPIIFQYVTSIPVAAQSKAWVYERSLSGIVGSNPAGGMNVCLLRVQCVQAEVYAMSW